jgi:hypothetical protein
MHALGLLTLKSFGIAGNIRKDRKDTKVSTPEGVLEKSYDIDISERGAVTGTYSSDLNLIELHEYILRTLDKMKKEETEKFNKIKTEEEYNISKTQSRCDRESSISNLRNANTKLIGLINDTDKKRYISDVSSIIEQYKNIGTIKKYVSFGKNVNFHDQEETIDKKLYRFALIEDFLNIAERYVSINISKKMIIKGCPGCGFDTESSGTFGVDTSSNDNLVCPNCGTESITLSKFKSSSEESSKKTGPAVYEGKTNFIKELSRYQGKSKNTKIPDTLIESLDAYFTQRNIPIGEMIKNGETTTGPEELGIGGPTGGPTGGKVTGGPTSISKDLMYRALKDLGFSTLYKDIHLICNIYWGWELINLDHLETKILETYDTINEVFESIKEENRSSSMNTQYELWWILNHLGYECQPSDFKIPKTPGIFEYHELKRREVCERLEWDFIPLDINKI